ncbi:hypothetical protein NPIL_701141 [Nephila pilipes]|uniref:Uncharacterized protein n=1 Tax=Nephila pilipes TaxID=299642 RepID=A0A8X6MXG1_NEPPI|nr:hypothetical protein NPIL_701141 [Nephila pilipes]
MAQLPFASKLPCQHLHNNGKDGHKKVVNDKEMFIAVLLNVPANGSVVAKIPMLSHGSTAVMKYFEVSCFESSIFSQAVALMMANALAGMVPVILLKLAFAHAKVCK